MSMLPGLREVMPQGQDQKKIKRYMTMMDSMTNEELDSTNPKLMNESRMMRIARGSGNSLKDVMELMEKYKSIAKACGNMKGLKIPSRGDMNMRTRNMNAQHMGRALPPQILQQIGGVGGLQNLMKQMGPMFGNGNL